MSATIVDLLPPEIAARRHDRRVAIVTALTLAAFLGVLVGVYLTQVSAVDAARADRDAVATDVTLGQARVVALQPYADMAARLEARNAVLASAMAPEVSWARLLNDVALALPDDASLLTVSATTGDTATGGAPSGDPAAAPTDGTIGRLDVTGYSTQEIAPGVRSVLATLPEIDGVADPFLSSAQSTDLHGQEVADFTLGAELDDGVRSHRYDDGLPPEASR